MDLDAHVSVGCSLTGPLFGLTWPSSLHMYGVASLLFPHDCVTLSQKGNWVDYEHEITLFAERNPGVKVVIYHKP